MKKGHPVSDRTLCVRKCVQMSPVEPDRSVSKILTLFTTFKTNQCVTTMLKSGMSMKCNDSFFPVQAYSNAGRVSLSGLGTAVKPSTLCFSFDALARCSDCTAQYDTMSRCMVVSSTVFVRSDFQMCCKY